MAAVPSYRTLPEARPSDRPGATAEILRFPRRRLTAVASDPREDYSRYRTNAATPEIAAGWAVALGLAALAFVLL